MLFTNVFIENEIVEWEQVAPGVSRALLAYEESLMLVKVKFESEAIGVKHQHIHVQMTYVESGVFEVEVGEQKKILRKGDCFYASSNTWHGVLCLEEGVLLDVFSPMRKDFLKEK